MNTERPFPELNLPTPKLKVIAEENGYSIWCIIRKKQLKLTPEEWVRQHVIHFLIDHKNTSIGRINSEHLININGQNRRCDVVVIDSEGKPILIVECKAHHVKIDEKTFLQTSNYVQETGAKYFWMTNGQMNVFMETGADVRYLSELPEF